MGTSKYLFSLANVSLVQINKYENKYIFRIADDSRTTDVRHSHSLPADHLLRHFVRDAAGPDLWPLPLAALAAVAWSSTRRPCVGREPQGQEESDPHGRCGCRHLRRLLVPNTGAYWKSSLIVPSFRNFVPYLLFHHYLQIIYMERD
jgi:hypothetical protein